MPSIEYLRDVLSGLTAYLYYKDHGYPHLVVRKGSGKFPEAEVKIRIENFEVLEVYEFSAASVNRIVKALRPYQKRLLEDWHETQQR